MPDLLSAFNGAIPVGALRSKQLHNRVNKLVIEKKKKVNPIVQGGESIVIEDLSEDDCEGPGPRGKEKAFPYSGAYDKEKDKEKLDETTPEMVKQDTVQEEVNEQKPKEKKTKRKYTKRSSRK